MLEARLESVSLMAGGIGCRGAMGELTFWRPSDDVHCLGVLGEGCEVIEFLAVGIFFYFPQLQIISIGQWTEF